MSPPPGDHTPPTSEYTLLSFLRLRIAGEPLPATVAAHFHDADIYAADPALLTVRFDPAAPAKKGESGGPWFFFTHVRPKSSSDSRKSRQVAGGVGTWHSERAPRQVLDDEGNCAGHSQYFSYKLNTGKNCSEKTEWHMVEFSDAQEADHGRVHGGEPELVLCKIYKAHTLSRGGNGSASRPSCSASARKRKAVDEASAPTVKAKRRLFDSPAPASVASSQEQVRSTTRFDLIHHQSFPAPASVASSQEQVRSATRSDLIYHQSSPAPASVASSQEQVRSATRSNLICHQSSPARLNIDSIVLMSKADDGAVTSQLKIGDTSDFSRFWPEPETECIALTSNKDGKASTSHLKIGDTSDFSRFWPEPETECIALTSNEDGEVSTSQLKIGDTSDFSRFWPELETVFDPGYSLMLKNYSTTNVRDVGDLFCRPDTWPSSFRTSNDTPAFVCGMPAASVLPPPAFVCAMPPAPVLPPSAFLCAMPSAPVLPPPALACAMPSAPVLRPSVFACRMPSSPVLLPLREASWWCGSHDVRSY